MSRDYLAEVKPELADALHYGVKGMKWGVRRDLKKVEGGSKEESAIIASKEKKQLAKVDKFNTNSSFQKRTVKAMAKAQKKAISDLNKEYKKNGVNLRKDRLARSRYEAELKNIGESSARAYLDKKFKSKSGVQQVEIHRTPEGYYMKTAGRNNHKVQKQWAKIDKARAKAAEKAAEVEHDAVEEEILDSTVFFLPTDSDGLVVDVVEMEDSLQQDGFSGNYLAHYGVKGMKWGVRRSSKQLADAAKTRGDSPTEKKSDPDGPETPASRYSRLAQEAKSGGAKNWSEQDLKFFNARTEALSKINKLNEEKPSWLRETTTTVIRTSAQRSMQSVTDAVANKYITEPLVKAIKAAGPDKDDKKS